MMLAHDIVGKKEDRERENTIHYWCEIYGVICTLQRTWTSGYK